jgi:hypothetical protein
MTTIDPFAVELEREMSSAIVNLARQLDELGTATREVLEAIGSGADQEATVLRVVTCTAELQNRYAQLGAAIMKLGEAITNAGQLSSQPLN